MSTSEYANEDQGIPDCPQEYADMDGVAWGLQEGMCFRHGGANVRGRRVVLAEAWNILDMRTERREGGRVIIRTEWGAGELFLAMPHAGEWKLVRRGLTRQQGRAWLMRHGLAVPEQLAQPGDPLAHVLGQLSRMPNARVARWASNLLGSGEGHSSSPHPAAN